MMFATDEQRFPGYDIVLKQRGRDRWKWAVCRPGGEIVMSGSECSRAAARYKAERALFLLLSAAASRKASVAGRAAGLSRALDASDRNRPRASLGRSSEARFGGAARSEKGYFGDIQDGEITKGILDLATHIVNRKAGTFDLD